MNLLKVVHYAHFYENDQDNTALRHYREPFIHVPYRLTFITDILQNVNNVVSSVCHCVTASCLYTILFEMFDACVPCETDHECIIVFHIYEYVCICLKCSIAGDLYQIM